MVGDKKQSVFDGTKAAVQAGFDRLKKDIGPKVGDRALKVLIARAEERYRSGNKETGISG